MFSKIATASKVAQVNEPLVAPKENSLKEKVSDALKAKVK
jgi:hypothetical protein